MRLSKKLILGFVLLFVGVSAALATIPPRVSWEPSRLAPASIAPGESATYSVTLIHTGILPIAATPHLRIVPEGEIAPFVTVTPPKFPPVMKRGDRVSVQVKVTVPPNTALSVKKGELLLERILPNGKVMEVFRAEALPVELIFSPTLVPADPGEAGKATLGGVDLNANGVRDDIERWVVVTNPTSEKLRAALFQQATVNQRILSTGATKDAANALAVDKQDDYARACLYYLLGTDKAIEMHRTLQAEFLNTRARSMAYLDYDDLLRGKVLGAGPSNRRDGCTFDLNAMRN